MNEQNRIVAPGMADGLVRLATGETRRPPEGWELLPPGDPGVTRRVKVGGPTWTVMAKRGRRSISLGIYAPAERIAEARAYFDRKRATPGHQRQQEQAQRRRERHEADYRVEFRDAIVKFLDFAITYRELGLAMAERITAHATPVGSGTVARTQRIPLAQRAEAATIAWLRHATTGYDSMRIARVKGKRREVRRMLAERSRDLLSDYRRGHSIDHTVCPLYKAVLGDAPAAGLGLG